MKYTDAQYAKIREYLQNYIINEYPHQKVDIRDYDIAVVELSTGQAFGVDENDMININGETFVADTDIDCFVSTSGSNEEIGIAKWYNPIMNIIDFGEWNLPSLHEFKIRGIEAVEKTVMSGSNTSARINVPSAWQGKRVMVVRLE